MRVIVLRDITIQLKKGSAILVEGGESFDDKTMDQQTWHYRENLIAILRSPGKRNPDGSSPGMAYDEMQQSGVLKRELQLLADGAEWILEDDDYAFVCAKVRSFPWPFQADVYEQFVEDILRARSVGKEELRKALGKNGQDGAPVPIGKMRS